MIHKQPNPCPFFCSDFREILDLGNLLSRPLYVIAYIRAAYAAMNFVMI